MFSKFIKNSTIGTCIIFRQTVNMLVDLDKWLRTPLRLRPLYMYVLNLSTCAIGFEEQKTLNFNFNANYNYEKLKAFSSIVSHFNFWFGNVLLFVKINLQKQQIKRATQLGIDNYWSTVNILLLRLTITRQ